MDNIWFWVIVLTVIGWLWKAKEDGKIAKMTANKQTEMCASIANLSNFNSTFKYLGGDGESGIAIDEPNGKVCLISRKAGNLIQRIVEYRDIISSELFEDGETISKTDRTSQIGSAVVGGLLLGGVGTIIGGLSGERVEKNKIKRIDLKLIINDHHEPTHNVCFLASETSRDAEIYKTISEQARQWQARISVLIRKADEEIFARQQAQLISSNLSISDELKKLAELKSIGVVTEAEFNAQKAKLLGVMR